MNTLNAATIARIQFVADCAHEDVALTTLKNAKDGIQNRTKSHAGYESVFAGVDMVLLTSLFAPALAARTKKEFTTFIEAIQAAMMDVAIELEKAHEARRAAEAHETTVMQYTGADFSDELYDAHTEALDEDKARRLAARTGFSVEQCRAELIAEEGNFLEARCNLLAIVAEAHAEAIEADKERTTTATVPAADIDAIGLRELHIPITAEESLPYVQKVVTRAYVARSIARALASYTKHHAKYTAQDRLWLADHNANHAHRNGVITGEEYAAIYHLCRAEGADPLKLIDAVRVALLTGRPVMPAVNAAASETTAA